jgi:hypothetical protein
MSVLIKKNKTARNVRIPNEKEASDLSRIDLNLIRNTIFVLAGIFVIGKSEEFLENDNQTFSCL